MKRFVVLLTAILAVVLWAGFSIAADTGTAGNPTTMSTSNSPSKEKLIGMTVADKQGKVIGDIKDVNVNSQTGKINFVILAKGGFMGIGADKYAVPLQVLKINTNEKKATLQVAEDMLEPVPSRTAGMSDQDYERQILNHYGLAPSWNQPSGASGTSGQGKMEEKKMNNGGNSY